MSDPHSEAFDREREAALRELGSVLKRVIREAGETQGLLQSTAARISGVVEQVMSVVGGSAEHIDQQIAHSLAHAVRESNSATSALSTAAAAARFFG